MSFSNPIKFEQDVGNEDKHLTSNISIKNVVVRDNIKTEVNYDDENNFRTFENIEIEMHDIKHEPKTEEIQESMENDTQTHPYDNGLQSSILNQTTSQNESSNYPLLPTEAEHRVFEPFSKQNELNSLPYKYLESSQESVDKRPTIAKVWGEKLLGLDTQQRLFAEKAINDILFEASLGTLNRYSVKINESS